MRSDRTREEHRKRLENQYNSGTLTHTAMTDALAQFDAAQATVRNAQYMLASVIVAAIAAVASAISAGFSAYVVWWPKK